MTGSPNPSANLHHPFRPTSPGGRRTLPLAVRQSAVVLAVAVAADLLLIGGTSGSPVRPVVIVGAAAPALSAPGGVVVLSVLALRSAGAAGPTHAPGRVATVQATKPHAPAPAASMAPKAVAPKAVAPKAVAQKHANSPARPVTSRPAPSVTESRNPQQTLGARTAPSRKPATAAGKPLPRPKPAARLAAAPALKQPTSRPRPVKPVHKPAPSPAAPVKQAAAKPNSPAPKKTHSKDDPEARPLAGYRLPKDSQPEANSGKLAVDVTGKLIFVVALMLLCAGAWKKLQRLAPGLVPAAATGSAPVSDEKLQVSSTVALAPQRFLHVVTVGGRQVLVASTPQQVSLIADLTPVAVPETARRQDPRSQEAPFSSIIRELSVEDELPVRPSLFRIAEAEGEPLPREERVPAREPATGSLFNLFSHAGEEGRNG